jgi:CHAT domain-containing protein/tetratricopeptide (TPR) repeat protein
MKTIGAPFWVFLVICVSGGPKNAPPHSKRTVLAKADTERRQVLLASLHRATALMHGAKYEEAGECYRRGYQTSKAWERNEFAVEFLLGLGNSEALCFRYREALESYLSVRKMFAGLGNLERVARLDINLCSLYSQMGEFEAASDAASRAMEHLPAGNTERRAKVLVLMADVKLRQGRVEEAGRLFDEGIQEADRFGDPELLSSAWDKLGAGLLLHKQLPQAEQALLEAYRIRKLNRLTALGSTYRNLGMLRLEQGDLHSAATLLDASIEESKSGRGLIPEWRFYQSRGVLRLAEGKLKEAYADFRLALELVRNYRLAAPAADATRVSLEGFVDQVYASFAETGSRLYLESPDGELARETFEAVEENRAGSLAARLDERKQAPPGLPPSYWDALGQLESAQSAALLDGGEEPRQAMRRARASLLDMEARPAGSGFRLRPDLLRRVQRALDGKTALLSFHLAPGFSCLWAVSASGFKLYRLPDRESIGRQALEFRRAIASGDAKAKRLGRRLYGELFGALEPEFLAKSRWLLSLDGELFDLPFAALVAGGDEGAPTYLVERNSLQTISGASIWEDGRSGEIPAGGAFVGVGDPIYNVADARWQGQTGARPLQFGWLWKASSAAPAAPGLSRLAGSGAEIEACAREWTGGSALLEGMNATKENVRRALAARPAVLHFATHVLEESSPPASGLIALSVSNRGRGELLGPAEIGGWNAGATLIVLSGCSSGVGANRPGAGLMGLTRAWLMAGARAVVATEWQTPDDVGVFFRRFYRRLENSPGRDPAAALGAAQIETIRSHDWRSHPAFWAAYFAMGNY